VKYGDATILKAVQHLDFWNLYIIIPVRNLRFRIKFRANRNLSPQLQYDSAC